MIMMNSNFKNISYDVISVTSSFYVAENCQLTSQHFSILGLSQSKFLATPVADRILFSIKIIQKAGKSFYLPKV